MAPLTPRSPPSPPPSPPAGDCFRRTLGGLLRLTLLGLPGRRATGPGPDADGDMMVSREASEDIGKKRRCDTEVSTYAGSAGSLTGNLSDASLCKDPDADEGPRLLAAGFQIPHPDKVQYGGEDAFFICQHGASLGVADGVSEWGWRFDMNPRDFAEGLMTGAKATAERLWLEGKVDPTTRAFQAMQEGFAATDAFGASTAIVAALDSTTSEVGVANLGDSGLRLLRRLPTDSAMTVVERTVEQQHSFCHPYQLSNIPKPEQYAALLAAGKKLLVEAVSATIARGRLRLDSPEDSLRYTFKVEDGDLLILGSDGLFDNLDDDAILEVVAKAQMAKGFLPQEDARPDPSYLARALATQASRNSTDQGAQTPFCESARRHGYTEVSGGIVDDITCVCAWVTRSREPR
mmetsp:Transcript_52302/g.154375  ORF Transcript_52302/g.154375 Transcript_52302/m.154375 type:complete len:405 (+) Transcript_52302:2-1216(+)